jgi:hypothetical protein
MSAPSRKKQVSYSNGLINTNIKPPPTIIGATYANMYNILHNIPPPPPPPEQPAPSQKKRPNWWYGGRRKTRKTKRKNRK